MMHPPEQNYQEFVSQQRYRGYTGAEHLYENQANEPDQHDFLGPQVGGEEIPGVRGQQQFYEQYRFSGSLRPIPEEGRVFAVLSYSLGWFSALILLFFGWRNRFIRFHALQALFFFGVVNAFDFLVVSMLFFWHHFHIWILPIACVLLLVNIIAAIAWLIGMIQAGLGVYYLLPGFGDIIMRKCLPPVSVK